MNAILVLCYFVLKAEPAAPHREKRKGCVNYFTLWKRVHSPHCSVCQNKRQPTHLSIIKPWGLISLRVDFLSTHVVSMYRCTTAKVFSVGTSCNNTTPLSWFWLARRHYQRCFIVKTITTWQKFSKPFLVFGISRKVATEINLTNCCLCNLLGASWRTLFCLL